MNEFVKLLAEDAMAFLTDTEDLDQITLEQAQYLWALMVSYRNRLEEHKDNQSVSWS